MEGTWQGRRAWKETDKTGAVEEELGSLSSLSSDWVCMDRTGFFMGVGEKVGEGRANR